ncbi:MAG: VOC family protein [bacterium]
MPRVMHFELHVDNPAKAVKFYESVFGWKAEKYPGPFEYWILNSGNNNIAGINGGVTKRQAPSESVINYIAVDSVKVYLKKITDAGGKIIEPKQPIPGIGYMAIGMDTEGITFGLIQPDMAIK